MKRGLRNILKNCYQILAQLLILLMLSIPFTQILHHHVNDSVEYTEHSGKTIISKTANHCDLCDYLKHNHSKDFLPSYTSLSMPLPQPIKIRANVIAGNYTFTLQGFTNKGPPAQFFSAA